MTDRAIKVAVVGHTNVGKTSLLRTLLRDSSFGDVSNHPATTRHVEGAALLVEGRAVAELYDTPGLEDSIGLLEHLETQSDSSRRVGIERLQAFLEDENATIRFSQEAKALHQLLACDVALYVIDTRDRVLGKHRDELSILGMSARPVVPVLNFTAGEQALTKEWRDHLARVNMHAVAEFDTVVLDDSGEQRLFEKMRTLLDPFASSLDALIEDRKTQRARLIRAASELVADLLIDVTSKAQSAPINDDDEAKKSMEQLRSLVRQREQRCVNDLLELYRFKPDDLNQGELPIQDGAWGLDLFNPEALKAFGVKATGAVAAGAMAGLAVDAMVGGITMGAAAATGAVLGALYSASRSHGKRLVDRARGYSEVRVNDATLTLLARRQIELVQALRTRGHASQHRIQMQDKDEPSRRSALPEPMAKAKRHPGWSSLNGDSIRDWSNEARATQVQHLADRIESVVKGQKSPASLFG